MLVDRLQIRFTNSYSCHRLTVTCHGPEVRRRAARSPAALRDPPSDLLRVTDSGPDKLADRPVRRCRCWQLAL